LSSHPRAGAQREERSTSRLWAARPGHARPQTPAGPAPAEHRHAV